MASSDHKNDKPILQTAAQAAELSELFSVPPPRPDKRDNKTSSSNSVETVMTVRQAAELWDVSQRRIRQWIKSGRLTAFKKDDKWHVVVEL